MHEIKPGRGPSALGALGGIMGVCFGIFWTVMAYSMTRTAPEPFRTFFPLFGILVTISSGVGLVYNLYNTTKKNRLSVFDITSDKEEPDPLNLRFGPREIVTGKETVESKLKELNDLHRKGVISGAERDSQRQRILNQI